MFAGSGSSKHIIKKSCYQPTQHQQFRGYSQSSFSSCKSAFSFPILFTNHRRWAGGGIFGTIIDTYGTHYVAIPCAFILTFSVTMLSLCTQYYQIFFAQGVGFGIAASGLFCCATTSTGQWFHKRKGLALGVVLAGSSTGSCSSSNQMTKIKLTCLTRWCHSFRLSTHSHQQSWLPISCAMERSCDRYLKYYFLLSHARTTSEEAMGSQTKFY